jgi:ParB family chromosome partitioning protein
MTTDLNGAAPTLRLDPRAVRPSRWANRHESSFQSTDFGKFKQEIAHAGGNVQPIKVRKADADEYEVVFGHRRLRACLELGLPVLATVVSISDQQLWQEMERENRSRADLSPYEQGCHYSKALDEGLYGSLRKLAEAIDIDASQVSKVIRIARLPQAVIGAFASPADIHVNWATALSEAVDRDKAGVLMRASRLTKTGRADSTPKQILGELVASGSVEPFHTQTRVIKDAEGKRRAEVKKTKAGYIVKISGAAVSLEALEQAMRELLNPSPPAKSADPLERSASDPGG